MANFSKPSMGTWARMLDTNSLERRQGDAFKQESYWPIGASQEIFSCIIVKACRLCMDSNAIILIFCRLRREQPLTLDFRGLSLRICQCE
jgi:hypothetical protein